MKKAQIRRDNLNARIQAMGGQATFIDRTGMNQGQVSSLQNGTGNGSFGEKLARKIEQLAGWPADCLDSPDTLDPLDQIEAAMQAADWLQPSERANLLGLMRGMRDRTEQK